MNIVDNQQTYYGYGHGSTVPMQPLTTYRSYSYQNNEPCNYLLSVQTPTSLLDLDSPSPSHNRYSLPIDDNFRFAPMRTKLLDDVDVKIPLPLVNVSMSVQVQDPSLQKKRYYSDYQKDADDLQSGNMYQRRRNDCIDMSAAAEYVRKIELGTSLRNANPNAKSVETSAASQYSDEDVKTNLVWSNGANMIAPTSYAASGQQSATTTTGTNNGMMHVGSFNNEFNTVASIAPSTVPRPARYVQYANTMPSFCQVCQDVAAGYHCGCYVCEACKKFFVRSAKGAHVKYSCANNGQCMVTRATRTRCQYCRYHKCLQLGMTLPGEKQGSQAVQQDSPVTETPCKVCGAPSSGFHFGAVTCEGCKGFFRRSVKEREPAKYVCPKTGNCEITQSNRNICKHCRFKKCMAVGMDSNGSRIGRQPAASKRKPNNSNWLGDASGNAMAVNVNANGNGVCASNRDRQNSAMISAPLWVPAASSVDHTNGVPIASFKIEPNVYPSGTNDDSTESEDEEDEETEGSDEQYSESDDEEAAFPESTSGMRPVQTVAKWTMEDFNDKPETMARMEREICSAYGDELLKINDKAEGSLVLASDDRAKLWDTMMKQFVADAVALTSFSKRLPYFNLVTKLDKLALVRTCMYQVCQTQLSNEFDLRTGEYNYFNFSREERRKIFETFPDYGIFERHFQKMRIIREMDLDSTECALFCALQLFTVESSNDKQLSQALMDGNGLMNGIESVSLVRAIHKQISTCLKCYCIRAQKGLKRYGDIMEKLRFLRCMTIEHQAIVTRLRRKNLDLMFPGLYVEMFNIGDN